MTIQRKTIEDIIAGREGSGAVNDKSGAVNGGLNVGKNVGKGNNINNCESDNKENINKTDVGVNVGVNDGNGGLNNENGGLNKNNCHEVIVNSRQKRIISLIKLKPTIIVEQMTSILSISKRSIERDLSMLQKAGVIRHEGSRKSGIWVVLEPYNSKML